MSQNLKHNYRDPVITKLIEIFEAEGPAELKGKYIYGNLFILPQNQNVLPAVFISETVDNGQPHSSSEDQSRKTYQLNVSVELKKEWGRSAKAVETHMDLQRYLCGMDAKTYNWLPDSFMFLLRKHQALDAAHKLYIDIDTITSATIQPGVEARGVGIFTYEGMIQFQVRHNQIRPKLA